MDGAPAPHDSIEIIDDPHSGEPVVLWGAPVIQSFAEPRTPALATPGAMRRLSSRAGDAMGGAAFRWNSRLAEVAPAGEIRSHSRVRLHAWAALPTLVDRLGPSPLVVTDPNGRVVLKGETALEHWTRGIHRAPAQLELTWSWPSIPVWVVAERWWRDHTVLTMSLRTNHRWRYPRRYWSTAHRALREIALAGRPDGPA